MITHIVPEILECEVKWALESITTNKAIGGDGIPVELFQILKDDVVKVLHSIRQLIWKTQQWPQDWKISVFTPIPEKGNAKECPKYRTIPLILHPVQVILQGLQKKFIIIDKLDAIRHETLETSPEGTVHNLENKI